MECVCVCVSKLFWYNADVKTHSRRCVASKHNVAQVALYIPLKSNNSHQIYKTLSSALLWFSLFLVQIHFFLQKVTRVLKGQWKAVRFTKTWIKQANLLQDEQLLSKKQFYSRVLYSAYNKQTCQSFLFKRENHLCNAAPNWSCTCFSHHSFTWKQFQSRKLQERLTSIMNKTEKKTTKNIFATLSHWRIGLVKIKGL